MISQNQEERLDLEFKAKVAEIELLEQERRSIVHKDRCGIEFVPYSESGVGEDEFVCYCDAETKINELNPKIESKWQQLSDFADTNKILNEKARKAHDTIKNFERAYQVAKVQDNVPLQLQYLEDLARFKEGAELAIKHNLRREAIDFLRQANDKVGLLNYAKENKIYGIVIDLLKEKGELEETFRYADESNLHEIAADALLKTGGLEKALSYAEEKGLHDFIIKKLNERKRVTDAVNYAEKQGFHTSVLELLLEHQLFDNALSYGEKYKFKENVIELLRETLWEGIPKDFEYNQSDQREKNFSIKEKICKALENNNLERSAELYRPLLKLDEKRYWAKKRIHELKNKTTEESTFWFEVADLELLLGNKVRYKKIWEETERIYKRKDNEDLASWASSMVNNPRFADYKKGVPEVYDRIQQKYTSLFEYPTQKLMEVTDFLAQIQEIRNEQGERKYPSVALEEVIDSWSFKGVALFHEFFKSSDFDYLGKDSRFKQGSKIVKTFENRESEEEFSFILHNFPKLLETNEKDLKKIGAIGKLYNYIKEETFSEGEHSPRRMTALENLLHIPIQDLNRENIFYLETGGPKAVWLNFKKQLNSGKEEDISGKFSKNEFWKDIRLQELYNLIQNDEVTKEKIKQLFFEAHQSKEASLQLRRTLTIYEELKKAYGKKVLPLESSPFYFFKKIPQDPTEFQNLVVQLMKELPVIPARRKQVAEAALGKPLHAFFEESFAMYDQIPQSEKNRLIENNIQFYAAKSEQLETYLTALKKTREKNKNEYRFLVVDTTKKTKENLSFLDHYDHFSRAILNEKSSLDIEQRSTNKKIIVPRIGKIGEGIKEKIGRELDGFRYIFEQIYQQSRVYLFNENKTFRNAVVSQILTSCKEKHGNYLDSVVFETLADFDFNELFNGKNEKDRANQKELFSQEKTNTTNLFKNKEELIFKIISDGAYYTKEIKKKGFSEEFTSAVNRLRMGLKTSFEFDELRIENNQERINNFFNIINECTSHGSTFQEYGYYHHQDKNIGILAANIYKQGKFQHTIGKGFLARCKDEKENNLLYVDGVVMLQDIADLLKNVEKEAHWKTMMTKAIIETAQEYNIREIVFNASHKLAQRSVWRYIKHIAELIELKEGQDYSYKEGKINANANLKTVSEDGFELYEKVASENCHYLEKLTDDSFKGEHLLEGFWLNHYEANKRDPKEKVLHIPKYILPEDNKEFPQINQGKGYIIGFRKSTEEVINLFNKKYAQEYGEVKNTL